MPHGGPHLWKCPRVFRLSEGSAEYTEYSNMLMRSGYLVLMGDQWWVLQSGLPVTTSFWLGHAWHHILQCQTPTQVLKICHWSSWNIHWCSVVTLNSCSPNTVVDSLIIGKETNNHLQSVFVTSYTGESQLPQLCCDTKHFITHWTGLFTSRMRKRTRGHMKISDMFWQNDWTDGI